MAKHPRRKPDRRRWRHWIAVGLRLFFVTGCLALPHCSLIEYVAAQQVPQRRPPVVALATSADGKHVLGGGQFGVEVYGLSDLGQELDESEVVPLSTPEFTLDVQMANVHAIAFSPSGGQVAIGGGAPSDGGAFAVYSWPELELQFRAQPHTDLVYGIAWSADGKQLATVSYDRDVKLIDPAAGTVTATLSGHSRPVLDVSWLPDSESLVTVGVDRSLRVWKAGDVELVRSLENHTQTIHAITLRPSTNANARPMVATAGADKTVRFWQPTIGRLVRFARLDAVPLDLAWTKDGRYAIAACDDGRLRSVDPDTAEVIELARVSSARLECIATVGGSEDKANRVAVGDSAGLILLVALPARERP